MDKEWLIAEINKLKERMDSDVAIAYMKDSSLGNERLDAWERAVKKFLNGNFSDGYYNKLYKKLRPGVYFAGGDAYQNFIDSEYSAGISFLESLILDIQNDELELPEPKPEKAKSQTKPKLLKKAFIVHGHDSAKKLETARFLEKIGFDAIILHEQANNGKTIIEKLEQYTDVGFGIVLYTPDDVGEAVANQENLKLRARQNVVFEHGLLMGKLGRDRVFPLVTDHNIELPGDISGMVYMSDNGWEVQLAREIKALGYEVDLNKLF